MQWHVYPLLICYKTTLCGYKTKFPYTASHHSTTHCPCQLTNCRHLTNWSHSQGTVKKLQCYFRIMELLD